MWIATRDNSEPYVIHINYSEDTKQEALATIAKKKEGMAEDILKEINKRNKDTPGNFKFVYRLIYLPPNEEDLHDYIKEKNSDVTVDDYQDVPTLFYAKYNAESAAEGDSPGVYGGWVFHHQSISSGLPDFKISNSKAKSKDKSRSVISELTYPCTGTKTLILIKGHCTALT